MHFRYGIAIDGGGYHVEEECWVKFYELLEHFFEKQINRHSFPLSIRGLEGADREKSHERQQRGKDKSHERQQEPKSGRGLGRI